LTVPIVGLGVVEIHEERFCVANGVSHEDWNSEKDFFFATMRLVNWLRLKLVL
jgi:hypothetical protein